MSRLSKTHIYGAALFALLFAATTPLQAHDDGHSDHGPASFDAGEPGDSAKPSRRIAVAMREGDGKMLFAPNAFDVKFGENITFVLRNEGQLDHEFVIGSAIENAAHAAMMETMPDMTHSDPNATSVKAGASGELTWRFSKAGEFEVACLIPGHYQAGMKGSVTVSGSATTAHGAHTP